MNVAINPSLKATMDINVVKDADVVLLAVPTIAIESICLQIDPLLTKKVMVVEMYQKDSIQKQMKECRKLYVVVSLLSI